MKKNIQFLLLLITISNAALTIQAQTTDWHWAKSACNLSAATSVTSITTDPAGNIFIAGNFRDSARFGNTVYHPLGTVNMFIAKYDSTGIFLWMMQGSGNNVPPYNLVTDLCADSSGNCYFTGFFNGNIVMSHDTITSANSMPDIFAGKITSAGNIAWLQQGLGQGSDYSYGIGVDTDGNCYVGGSFEGGISFGNLQLTANNSSYDIFILKLDATGNFSAAHAVGGSAVDLLTSMTVDKNGNCFAAGTFTSPDISFGNDTLLYTNSGADAYVAKFDSAGNSLWGRSGFGPGIQEPSSIAADLNGNCYVTGLFKGDTMHLDTFTLVSYGYWDFFTAAYDSTGTLLHAGHQGSAAFGPENCSGIAADTSGNYYTTGLFRNPATFDTINVTSLSPSDIFVTKFNATGNALWVEQSGSGAGGLTAAAIHIDQANQIFIVGSYEASTIIGNDSLVVEPGYTSGYYFAKIGAIDTTTTSVSNLRFNQELRIYPVPATDELYFNAGGKIDAVSVFDIVGNKIFIADGSAGNRINVSAYPAGVYFLEIKSGASTIRKKFIRQ